MDRSELQQLTKENSEKVKKYSYYCNDDRDLVDQIDMRLARNDRPIDDELSEIGEKS